MWVVQIFAEPEGRVFVGVTDVRGTRRRGVHYWEFCLLFDQ